MIPLEAPEVADVTDVVSAPRFVHVLDLEFLAGELFEPCDRLEDRDRVRAPPADVVDRARARALGERERRGADVRGVDVVPDLLALVAVDPVRATFANAPREVREEPVQLGAGVVRSGQTASPEADRGHAEVAPVLLHEQLRSRLR